MVSINQAIFSYPDGTGAMALSEHHYKLVAFAQQFAMRTGAKVEGIARRHDVCGFDCGRLHYRLCEKCDAEPPRFPGLTPLPLVLPALDPVREDILPMAPVNNSVTKTSPLVPIPSPVDGGKVSG